MKAAVMFGMCALVLDVGSSDDPRGAKALTRSYADQNGGKRLTD